MRILVTGARGKIGSLLLPRLERLGQVIAFDISPCPTSSDSPVQHVKGSVGDEVLLEEIASECSHVIHLTVGNSNDWNSLVDTDVRGTRNVLRISAQSPNVVRVVLASTNHVVGGHERDVLHTQARKSQEGLLNLVRPDSEYATVKAFAEAYGRYIAEATNTAVSCLRIGTVRLIDDPARYLDEPGFRDIPGGPEGVLARLRTTWLHHDDLWRIFSEELHAVEKFRIRFAVSDNPGRFWPLDVATWNP